MELWTEYEGTTIDGAFPLNRLLQPEGRSALFATSDTQGAPRILRLIESHFDEDEILARWRGVAALNHPHLLRLDDFGKVTLDETALVYAVMEPSDANLAEVLVNQRLSQAETRQLAESIASALDALHGHGFVHEHVEPASILAVGEVVKLRSDCIREAPEGAEGLALKQRDIQNLCTVMLQALTGQRTLESAGPLPAPFDRILFGGLRGGWGAPDILGVLRPTPSPSAPPPVAPSPAPAVSATASATPSAAAAVTAPVAAPASTAVPSAARTAPTAAKSAAAMPPARPAEAPAWEPNPESRSAARVALMAGGLLAVVLCLWLGWRILHRPTAAATPASPAVAVVEPSQPAQPLPAHSGARSNARPSAAHVPSPSAPEMSSSGSTVVDPRPGWRVIAYTYNHEDQAQHKAAVVAREHPELHPRVFTPTGHAPYLVELGGLMSRDQAFALAGLAHRDGLPHDVFARNYH